MKRSLLPAFSLTCLMAVAQPVAAQDVGNLAGITQTPLIPLDQVDQRLVQRFPSSVAVRFGTLIDSVRQEGLPVEPLVQRALEGGAKRIPADRIQAALIQLRDGLRRAQQTLGKSTTTPDLTTAASALQAGLKPTSLAQLKMLRGTGSLSVPLGTYLDLVARGAVRQLAWEEVLSLARESATDSEYSRVDASRLVARPDGNRR